MSAVRQFFDALLDVILPPTCHVCHSFIPNAGKLHLCTTCKESFPLVSSPFCSLCGIPFAGSGNDHYCSACCQHPPHFDRACSPFLYEGPIRDLIHSFKYNRNTHLRYPLALLTLEGIDTVLSDCDLDLIVPVPLHRSRLRQRGFNQAVLLGRTLARYLDLEMVTDSLVRTRATEPQIELTAAERRINVKDAFTVRKPEFIAGKQVLLLDDVMTTGSTMNECARELKKAGATAVIAVTAARAAK
jgi:ComF family protein